MTDRHARVARLSAAPRAIAGTCARCGHPTRRHGPQGCTDIVDTLTDILSAVEDVRADVAAIRDVAEAGQ